MTTMQAIRCGNCKSTHNTVAEVRDCFANPEIASATERQINYAQMLLRLREPGERFAWITEDQINGLSKADCSQFIEFMNAQPFRPKPTDDFDLPHPEVPAGSYALRGADGVVRFWRIIDANERYSRSLFSLRGAPGALARTKIKRFELAQEVMADIAADPAAASRLFGQELEYCGVCNSPLTNDESKKYGIGPVCRSKTGW